LDECIRRQELAASLLLILLADDEKLDQYGIGLGPELMDAIKMHKCVTFLELFSDRSVPTLNYIFTNRKIAPD